MFATLDLALADSSIAASDAQVAYASTRPITAIQTTTDPTWNPLIATPTTPSYVSEHAAYGVAASNVLAAFYGANVPFTTTTNGTTNDPTRTFSSFAAAGAEDGSSRVYSGDNFRFDVTAGANLGNSVANTVLAKFPLMQANNR